MRELCTKCNICSFTPAGERSKPENKLCTENVEELTSRILILDSVPEERIENARFQFFGNLFEDTPFTYSRTIRCEHHDLADRERQEAVSKCAVWTNSLLNGRALILATLEGLKQMKVEDRKEGDLFKSGKYGVVLVIPHGELDTLALYPKIWRAVREAGI